MDFDVVAAKCRSIWDVADDDDDDDDDRERDYETDAELFDDEGEWVAKRKREREETKIPRNFPIWRCRQSRFILNYASTASLLFSSLLFSVEGNATEPPEVADEMTTTGRSRSSILISTTTSIVSRVKVASSATNFLLLLLLLLLVVDDGRFVSSLRSRSQLNSTSSLTSMVTTTTTTNITIDCNGTYYEPQGNIQFSDTMVSISNCIFNDSNVQVTISSVLLPFALSLQNCTFLESSLSVSGEDVLPLVLVNSSSFVASDVVIQSSNLGLGVVITNSNFTTNSNQQALQIIRNKRAILQGCKFIDNKGYGIYYLQVQQCDVHTSTFSNNFLALLFEYSSATVSHCTFSNRKDAMAVIYAQTGVSHMNIQDCKFINNINLLTNGAVQSTADRLSVTRCVFRHNILKQTPTAFTANGGAAIHILSVRFIFIYMWSSPNFLNRIIDRVMLWWVTANLMAIGRLGLEEPYMLINLLSLAISTISSLTRATSPIMQHYKEELSMLHHTQRSPIALLLGI